MNFQEEVDALKKIHAQTKVAGVLTDLLIEAMRPDTSVEIIDFVTAFNEKQMKKLQEA